MPLLKGRQYPQVKPLSRKNISQSDKVYVIAHTDEEFLSKEEYDKRVALYEEQVWTCQCTGAVKLTHREALESEKNILQMLKEEFPPVFEKAVLEVVHHSTHALEQLIDEAYRKLHESLVIGESVSLKVSSASKQIKGTVQKVDSTHSAAKADKKESSEDTDGVKRSPPKLLPHMYSIKIDGEEKTINGIPASDLQRITKVPRKDLLKFFIRAHAVRASTHPNSPWVVNSNLVQKFSLVNRFNSFLTGGKPNGKENAESCPQKRKRSVSSNDQKPAKKQRQDSSADEKNKGSTSKTDSTKKSQTVPSKSPSTSGVKKSLWPLKTESKTGGKNSKESNDLSSEGSGDIKSRENGIVINDDDSDDDDEGASASAAKVSKSLNNSSNDGKKSKEDKKNGKSTPKKKRKSEEAGDKSLDKKKASISKEKSGTKKGSPKKEAKVVLYRLADSSGKKSPDKKMKQVTLYQLVSKKSEQSGSKTPTKTKKPKSDDDSPRYSLVKKTPSKNKSPREDDDSVKYSLVKKTPSKTPSKSPNKTPAKADGTNSAVKKTPLKPPQPAIVIMLQKAKKEGNKMKIAQLIARCAKELSDKQIKSLPSDVSEEVNKKYAAVQEKRKIEKMTPEEKEAYLQKKKEEMKQRVKENLKRKWEESKKRYEDTELDLVALPVPKIVTTPDGIANELFGSVVMVTEFIHCYKSLLTPEDKTVFTADELMLALDKGQAGFSFVAEVICILLQTLLQDQLAEDYKELKVPLSQLAVNEYTCTELLRLCLRKKDSAQDDDGTSSQASDSTDAFSEDAEVPEGLIDQLESCEMYELDIESQICLLVGLCHRVMGTYSLQEYMEEKQQDAAELWKKKIAGLKDINDQKKREKKQKKEKADQQQESEKPNQSSDSKGTLTISSFYGTASTSTEETNSAADDDMMSAIKNRRQNSNRLAGLEERKQKEEEKRLVKEKELQEYRVLKDKEAFEKQFKAGIQMGKKVFRLSPLGTDRQHNRYWFFSTTKPGIYIEKGWAPDEIDYCVGSDSRSADSDESSEDDDEEVDQTNAAEKISRTVVEKTIPHKGQNLWFLLDTVADFEKLLEGLHPLGARESVLKTRLMKEKEDIIKALSSSKTSESAAAKEKEEMDFVEGFRTELLDTETRLSCGGLGGVPDLDKWEERLKKADSIPVFAKLLAETKQHTMEKFLHGMLSETGNVKKSSKESQEDSGNEPEEENTPKSNGVEMWLEALNQCSTYSRLHVLLGMLDSCINWDKSVENVKCRICRKKGREDDHLLLCDECNQPFHLFCLRPALLEIPIGEWFCASCSHERPVRRAREVAKISSAMNEDSEEEEEEEDEGIADLEHDEDCIMCGGTDNLVPCSTCTSVFHIDCHDPPLRRPPRANTWKCMQCRTGQRIIKKNSKGRASNKSSSSRRKPVVKADEDDDDDDDYSPSEKRKRATRPEQKGRRNVRRVADSTDDSSEEESPAPSRSRNSSKTRKPDNNNRTSQKKNIPESSGKTQNGIDKAVVVDIINRLMKHRSSWPFQEPVDPEEVPDYHKLVKEPMDLQTMRDRCLSDVYTKPQHFINDFSLMMKNAEQYNQENSAVSKCIQPLEKYFENCLNRHFPQCKYQSIKST